MPPKVPEKGIQSISSFFKPKTPSATAKSEVIILDSSSDEDERQDVSGSREPLPKRIKLEHGHNFSTAASTSSSTCLNTATINNTTSSSSSSHAPPTQTFKRLQSFSYDPQASTSKKVLTSFEQKRRDKFIEKLVLGGHGRRKKQSSYLQDEHFMAPTREEEEEEDEDYERGSDYSGGGMEEEADDDEEETDTFRGGRMKKDLKGKGKARDQDETNSGSTASTSTTKFSKFLAKTSSSKTNTISTTTKIKYTPLEQQVIALKKANPGVLLAVEVSSFSLFLFLSQTFNLRFVAPFSFEL
jgi:DNA mismatch repair protein MSH3